MSVRRWFYRSRRWRELRLKILERDGRTCAYCGGIGFTVHHRVPISEGGALWDEANLEVTCRDCHRDLHRPAESPEARAWRAAVRDLESNLEGAKCQPKS